jgi:hypothetical protein
LSANWPAKDPDEVLDYSWDVPLDAGDTITGTPTRVVIAGTVTAEVPTVNGALVTTFVSGGVAGETAVIEMKCQTAGGRSFEETFVLPIKDSAAVPTDADNLRADIAALEKAQMDLASGKMVTEVWRSGRRLIYGKITISALQTLIDLKTRKLAEAEQVAAGKKRRRAITLGWPN